MHENRTQYLIERYLDAVLTPEEHSEFDDLRASHPALEQQISDGKALRNLLQSAKPDSFNPFFQSRVMRRINQEHESTGALFSQQLADAISQLFPRVAALSLAMAGLLMISNFIAATNETPLIDALLGLPTDSPEVMMVYGE